MRDYSPQAKARPVSQAGAEKPGSRPEVHPLLQLQSTLGNQGVLRRLSVGKSALQRQPAPPAPTPAPNPTPASTPAADPTAANVSAAVALLKDASPTSIHQYLSAVQVGSGSTTVATLTDKSGSTSTSHIFNLALQVGTLSGHAVAEFQGAAPVISGDTRTYAMTITLSPAVANTPPETLARDLYHEGLHMRLFMDRAVPKESSYAIFRMESYLTLARNSKSYASLLSDLATYMQKNATGKTLATAKSEAKQIVERIIEEKFIMDESVRSGVSKKPQLSASDLSRNYQSLTTRWLVTYLGKFGVSTNDGTAIGSLAGQLRGIWGEIDAEQERIAQLPVLVPKSSGPFQMPPVE